MGGSWYEQRIHRALETIGAAEIGFRLSVFPDRNLAIALKGLESADRNRILALLPAAKRVRVDQETEYLSRLRLTAFQIRQMSESLAEAMDGRSGATRNTWIAPARTRI